jgi:hypothetical protein
MTQVSSGEKTAMANLIALMNSGVTYDDAPVIEEAAGPSIRSQFTESVDFGGADPMLNTDEGLEIKPVDMPLSAAAGSMKKLLEAMYTAEADEPVQKLVQTANESPRFREALGTQKTSTGTRVGSWEIRINEQEGLKNYDVVNVKTGEPIASDLSLYDAAFGLVRCLNEGMTINNVKVRQILSIEAEYLRRRNDAANYKINMQLAERRNDSTKAAIMEDRFSECLAQAKTARVKLNKLVK